MIQLLPCPFCGSKVKSWGWRVNVTMLEGPGAQPHVEIKCAKCKVPRVVRKSMKAAAKVWNRRMI